MSQITTIGSVINFDCNQMVAIMQVFSREYILKNIAITHFRTGETLFEGPFKSLGHAVEAAIEDDISLAFADLRHANLINAQMDGAILDSAQLTDANLLGANISEASLHRTSFKNAQMHSTVLCESIIEAANFEGTLFGATDIASAQIRRCLFNTLSTFSLNFRDADLVHLNGFMAAQEQLCEFSRPPLILGGLAYPIICLDHKLLVHGHTLPLPTEREELPSALFTFIRTHRPLLETLWHAHNGSDATLRAA